MIVVYVLLVIIGIIFIVALAPAFYTVYAVWDTKTVIRIKAVYFLFTYQYLYENGSSSSSLRFAGIRFNKKRRKKKRNSTKNVFVEKTIEKLEKSEKSNTNHAKHAIPKSTPKKWYNTVSGYAKLLTSPDHKIIIGLIYRCVQKYWRRFLPKRTSVDGVIGTGDPFNTSMMLGAYETGTAMFCLRDSIRFTGDFEQEVFNVHAKIVGRINLFTLFSPIVWLLLKKPIRHKLIAHYSKDSV